MAKPRVFVSSTYYELKHIRNSLEAFIENMGYEAVLYESGDIPFRHDIPTDESCYDEIVTCHMLVLVIGGRFGSPASESGELITDGTDEQYQYYNSITQKEYEKARERDIPIFMFVDKNVYAEYETYKNNRDNDTIQYAYVDSINIFKLLDDILSQRRNNYIKDFEKFDDISSWLKDQWAGLFAEFLGRTSNETTLKDLSSQISQLGNVTSVLKEYTESIMKKVQPNESKNIIKREQQRLTSIKIQRFQEEEMISYIMRHYKKNPNKLYNAMKRSDTVEEFLKNSGFNKTEIAEFISNHESEAKRDLNTLRLKYFNIIDMIDENQDDLE